jgi:hypothetical protein
MNAGQLSMESECHTPLRPRCRCSIAVAPGLRFLPYFSALCRVNPLIFFRCNIGGGTLNQRVAGSSPARLTTYLFLTKVVLPVFADRTKGMISSLCPSFVPTHS